MKLLIRWIAILTMAFAAAGTVAASQDGVDVRLSVPNPVVQGDVDVVVTVIATNLNRHPVKLLRWQLPTEELEGALFRIERDGEKVAYTGPLIKRPAPGPADWVQLDPGTSLSYQVELTGAYDLSRNGLYTIEYLSRGSHGQYKTTLRSEKLYLWLEGRHVKAKVAPTPKPSPGGSISYSGNCSASQQATLQSAASQAAKYSGDSRKYLATVPPRSQRYPEWFGVYTPERGALAYEHFVKLTDAFTNKPVTLDCKCKKPYYAYVYPNQPYIVYLCSVFWQAPLTGTDSQAGTLVHEMSHFTVVAGTDDWAYGQTAAMSLAVTDPDKALDNADSHEYFSENSAGLP